MPRWACDTRSARDVIGKPMLSDMLEGGDEISDVLQEIVDVRTEPRGINVISVEVKEVPIPSALEDAIPMQAQTERKTGSSDSGRLRATGCENSTKLQRPTPMIQPRFI